jgi:single-strand DNA-binding protein
VNDTFVTVVGNVVDSPRRVRLDSGSVTNFRMASTARRYDTKSQEFVDSGTLWVDIECWNDLGANVSSSVSKGDPVIVQGALTTHSWESENGKRSAPRIKAFAVGPNLARGSAEFKRNRPARTTDPVTEGSGPAVPEQEPADQGFGGFSDHLLVAGQDYLGDDDASLSSTVGDREPEPAHV